MSFHLPAFTSTTLGKKSLGKMIIPMRSVPFGAPGLWPAAQISFLAKGLAALSASGYGVGCQWQTFWRESQTPRLICCVRELLNCCSSTPLGPASSGAAHVFPGTGKHANATCMCQPHRSTQAATFSTHKNANSTNGHILFLSLADPDEGPLAGNTQCT